MPVNEIRPLIVLKSVHHHSTLRVAEAMVEVMGGRIVEPVEATAELLAEHDVIGVGSGIYYGRFHAEIRDWAAKARAANEGQKAFVLSTSGLPMLSGMYHRPLVRQLETAGFDVVAEFRCSGHDSWGPLWFFGGLHQRHPDAADLRRAREFATALIVRVVPDDSDW